MFARYSNIKLGKMFEDDATNINDVEKALSLVNVKIRDTATSFRPMGDVFDEVASKWSTYNELEQSAIANALAGVRQRENFLTLMSNYNVVLEQQTMQTTAAGQATERYQIYLESIEAAANKSKASWEAVWQKTINNDVIKFFYNLSAAIANSIDKIGGLIPLVLVLGGAFVSLNFKSIVGGISSVVSSLRLMFTVISTGAAATAAEVAVATAGLSLIIAGIVLAISSMGNASSRLENTMQKISDTTARLEELKSNTQLIKDLSEEFKKLEENSNRTTEEQQKFLDVQNQLKDLLPQIAGYYDQSGNFIISDEALSSNQSYLDLLQQQIDAEQELLFLQTKKEIKQGATAYEQNATDINLYSGILSSGRSAVAGGGALTSEQIDNYKEKIATLKSENSKFLTDVAANWGNFTEDQQSELMKILANTGDFGEELTNLFESSQRDVERSRTDAIFAQRDTISENEEEIQSTDDLVASSESLTSSMDAVAKAAEEQAKNGQISNATALDLISSNADLAMYLIQTADGYIFDAEAARAATQAEMINEFTKYGLASAAVAAANGNYILANSMIVTANLASEETARLQGLLRTFAAMSVNVSIPSVGGGSGVSAQEKLNNAKKESYELEIKAYNAQKKSAQAEIDALEARKDAYNDLIDAKKESLRLTKEEDDYQKELADKNKELADIDNELLQLQFDNSEEANARRLELEEERAEKTADIAEYQADRTYDIQIEALDREAEAFEKMIDMQISGINTMISGFDAMIAKINEMIDALGKMSNASGGSGGYTQPTGGTSVIGPTGYNYSRTTIGAAESAAKRDLNGNGVIGLASGGSFEVLGTSSNADSRLLPVAPGELGIAINRSQQNSIAPLASLFSSIMKNTNTSPLSFENKGVGGNGDISVSIGDIIVQGSLDKNAIPAMKDMIMQTTVDALRRTGITRNASSFIT